MNRFDDLLEECTALYERAHALHERVPKGMGLTGPLGLCVSNLEKAMLQATKAHILYTQMAEMVSENGEPEHDS